MKNLQAGQKLSASQARELYEARSPKHGIFAGFTSDKLAIVDGTEYVYTKNAHGAELLEFRGDRDTYECIHLNSWA